MKVCSKCKIEKDESEFGNDKSKKSGKRGTCKGCDKITKSLYTKSNKDKVKQSRQTSFDKNKNKYYEKQKIKRLEYRLLNPIEKKVVKTRKEQYLERKDEINKIRKIARENNRDKYLTTRKHYYDKNSKEINLKKYKRDKQRLLTDSSFKSKKLVKDLFRNGLLRKGTNKNNSFFSYTEKSYADYITYFENNYPEEFAEITVKGKYHIDHIIPCAVYDFNNIEHIKLCWQPENLRIISAKENLEKNDKLDFELIKKHNIYHLLPIKLQEVI